MRVMWDGKGGRGEASASFLIWTKRWTVVPLTNEEEQIKGCLTRGGEGEHLRVVSLGFL